VYLSTQCCHPLLQRAKRHSCWTHCITLVLGTQGTLCNQPCPVLVLQQHEKYKRQKMTQAIPSQRVPCKRGKSCQNNSIQHSKARAVSNSTNDCRSFRTVFCKPQRTQHNKEQSTAYILQDVDMSFQGCLKIIESLCETCVKTEKHVQLAHTKRRAHNHRCSHLSTQTRAQITASYYHSHSLAMVRFALFWNASMQLLWTRCRGGQFLQRRRPQGDQCKADAT
jgi:hypothetical protein